MATLTLSACATASAQVAPLPMALCAGWQGERVCEQLHEDAPIRVLRCTFAPGVGHETTTYLIVEKKYEDRRAPEAVAPGLC
jgi:hypothetical protein